MPDSDYLLMMKQQQNDQLIQHLNSVTYRLLSVYPQAEVESWTIQKVEAEAIVNSGDDATISMAPFISQVCLFHHGASDDASRLAQIKVKAAAICANATAWGQVAAFINGIRARTQDEIEAATTIDGVFTVMNNMRAEVEAFRIASGI